MMENLKPIVRWLLVEKGQTPPLGREPMKITSHLAFIVKKGSEKGVGAIFRSMGPDGEHEDIGGKVQEGTWVMVWQNRGGNFVTIAPSDLTLVEAKDAWLDAWERTDEPHSE